MNPVCDRPLTVKAHHSGVLPSRSTRSRARSSLRRSLSAARAACWALAAAASRRFRAALSSVVGPLQLLPEGLCLLGQCGCCCGRFRQLLLAAAGLPPRPSGPPPRPPAARPGRVPAPRVPAAAASSRTARNRGCSAGRLPAAAAGPVPAGPAPRARHQRAPQRRVPRRHLPDRRRRPRPRTASAAACRSRTAAAAPSSAVAARRVCSTSVATASLILLPLLLRHGACRLHRSGSGAGAVPGRACGVPPRPGRTARRAWTVPVRPAPAGFRDGARRACSLPRPPRTVWAGTAPRRPGTAVPARRRQPATWPLPWRRPSGRPQNHRTAGRRAALQCPPVPGLPCKNHRAQPPVPAVRQRAGMRPMPAEGTWAAATAGSTRSPGSTRTSVPSGHRRRTGSCMPGRGRSGWWCRNP